MKHSLIPFILTNGINITAIIIIVVCAVAVVAFVIFLIIFLSKKKKGARLKDGNAWLLALGGKENIKEIMAVGSRLSINLLNKEIIDRERLKELGVSSVLVMSNKVTLVIEDKAEQVAAAIQKEL